MSMDELNKQELKPCRRCGSQIMAVGKSNDERWAVFCFRKNCLIVEGETKEKAIKAWNRRADDGEDR